MPQIAGVDQRLLDQTQLDPESTTSARFRVYNTAFDCPDDPV